MASTGVSPIWVWTGSTTGNADTTITIYPNTKYTPVFTGWHGVYPYVEIEEPDPFDEWVKETRRVHELLEGINGS